MGLTTASGVAADLSSVVTPGHLATDVPTCSAAAVRGVVPGVIVWPGSVQEVSRILALAHDRGLAVVPRGSGSALGIGAVPRRADIVLDLTRLDRVLEYEPADVSLMVEAGMTLRALREALAPHRQQLPLDPPGWATRTVGGVLASNASGPLRTRYGTGRDLLLGVRIVLADGSVVWGGSKVVKSVTGYDVPKLMVGAYGTLGVIVEAALRLHPEPWGERSWIFEVRTPATAAALLGAMFDSTLEPTRVEVLNATASARAGGADHGAMAIAVSIAGVDEAIRAQGEVLAALAAGHGGTLRETDAVFWTRYADVPAPVATLRVSCLAAATVETMVAIETAARSHGLDAVVTGTPGAGALRAALDGPDAVPRLAPIVTALREQLAPSGGSVVIERCPPMPDGQVDVWGPTGDAELAVMRRLKLEFDPTGVLNPGRFVGGL